MSPKPTRRLDIVCFLHAQLARLLEVGLIINLEEFPAFRVAFEPEVIKWDVDPAPFYQRASEIAKGAGLLIT